MRERRRLGKIKSRMQQAGRSTLGVDARCSMFAFGKETCLFRYSVRRHRVLDAAARGLRLEDLFVTPDTAGSTAGDKGKQRGGDPLMGERLDQAHTHNTSRDKTFALYSIPRRKAQIAPASESVYIHCVIFHTAAAGAVEFTGCQHSS